ncbi:PQQ-binding-like beta-propeller repeat protein [Micromonospora halotolerans]|uniref:PQQ-binding-like beta-propeller repeat protein n=1 Tax=Micromonospora halotolerans TaxID=709879 RepID=A0ABZ0A0P5_9ACTN|nr:PQQ-binding-like beta-propeller repeat protein [Micromonospora halotolerans]WNM40395.1 PQQ-binding-like beta-propeller repeat protein [Micromonospora halotolerans]
MAAAVSPVIELGEMRHGDEADELARAPLRPPGRLARVAAVCCVALLTLAGATSPARPPAGVRVAAPQGAVFLVLAGRLVVADGPGAVGQGGRVVTGHRLPGGEPVWRFILPAGDHVLGLDALAGGLLVTSSPAGAGDTVSTLLDPVTGVVRWRQTGYPVSTASGGVLFETPRASGKGTVLAVDPASGAVRWSLPLPTNGVSYRMDDGGPTQIVLVAPDGRVEVHDADSGALVHAGRVPPATDRLSYRFTQVVADLLLVDGAPGTVTAYGLDQLDRRWSMPLEPPGGVWFVECAGMVCVRDQVGGVRALDPATGRLSWVDDSWLGLAPIGGRLLGVGPEELSVLDPATGHPVTRLGRWRPTGFGSDPIRLLGLRRLPGDRTLVGALDVAAGEVRTRAVLPGSWNECADSGTALVCLRPSGGLMIWPVGP